MDNICKCPNPCEEINYGNRYLETEPKGPTQQELQARSAVRRAILRKLRQEKFFDALNKKLEKGTYQVKQNQLFRRMQIEKNEKELQDCLCKEEQDKKRRSEQICQEERFARALRESKDEENRQSAFMKQLYSCSPEIRELERQLRRGYYAKTLYAQRLELEALKLEEKMRQQENYDILMEKMAELEKEDEERRLMDCKKKQDYAVALKNQLEDVTSKMAKKQNEFAKDKEMIDEIIASIQQEEIQDLIEKEEKMKLYQQEIKDFMEAREMHRLREKERLKAQEDRIQKYVESKESQRVEFEKAKEAAAKAKAGIVAKAIDRIMKEQFKQEELEELRRELYEEELAADVRKRELEELEKRQRQMMELRAAAEEARRLRDEKLAADKKEEEEYRDQLMKKFAEDERLEQLANNKRRQKEREHRKIVEQMIAERRCLKAQAREREQEALDCFELETKRRENLIDEERLRLLKQHGPKLLGFLPRGIIKSWEEIEKLGEPFISYYKNQPLEPDPSTIDTEPCEEEIFNNMELPKYAKY